MSQAQEILNSVGGGGNVVSLSHCATRLRFQLVDASNIDVATVEQIKGVMGAVPQAGERFQIIMGAGNKVTNSYRDVSGLDEATINKIMGYYQKGQMDKVTEILQKAVPNSGGQVMVMGGGNTVDYAQASQVMGVSNILKGTKDAASKYNLVDGFQNNVDKVQNTYVVGANNKIDNTQNTIVIGDNHSGPSYIHGTKNSVIIGNGRTIKDGDVISIVRKYLVSGIMIDDEYEDSIVGTPQGGNLSPLLANIMLNELDMEMETRGLNFVRYADDCIIMVRSEMSANRVMRNISRFIEEKLGLKVNMTKSKVDRPDGLKYLGFGFFFDTQAQQYKARPHAKSIAKLKTKMKWLTRRNWSVSNRYKIEKLNQLTRGWINYFGIGYMKWLCKDMDALIRRRLRMCIWVHWKTPKNRAQNLMKLGMYSKKAYAIAYSGARVARLSEGALNYVITNKRLASFGLVSMYDYYTERFVKC